jgi:hypothetical protein
MQHQKTQKNGLLGACIVCLLAGTTLGFGEQQGAVQTLDAFVDLLELRSGSLATETTDASGQSAYGLRSFAVSASSDAEPMGMILDAALPMPGMFGPSTGLAIRQSMERYAFEQAALLRKKADQARAYTERAFRLEPTPRNFRGLQIDHAAPVRYVETFENEGKGQEWTTSSRFTEGDMHSRYLGPVRSGEQVLYIRVDPGEAYTLKFDLYLIGVPKKEYDPNAEIKIVVDGVPLATLGYDDLRRVNARLNGNEPDFDEDIARELLVPFIATGGVVEICFCGGSEALFSPGSWGLDNVIVEATPTNPGVMGGGGGSPASLGGRYASGGGGGGSRSFPQGRSFNRDAPFKGTPGSGGGGGSPTPFDFTDFFDPPEPEDPPLDDPPEVDPPNDPPPLPPPPVDPPDPPDDPPVPTPGTLFLGPMLALGAMRRRRR